MARPRKPINYEEEISRLDAQITRCDNTKAELIARRQQLLTAQREASIGSLYDEIQNAGVSVDEIVKMIRQKAEM